MLLALSTLIEFLGIVSTGFIPVDVESLEFLVVECCNDNNAVESDALLR